MRAGSRRRGTSLRVRLAAVIAVTFTLAAVGLVGTIYLAMDRVLAESTATYVEGPADPEGGTCASTSCEGSVRALLQPSPASPDGPLAVDAAAVDRWTTAMEVYFETDHRRVVGEVRAGLLRVSLATLGVFGAVAAALAWWATRRALRRLEEVTDAVHGIGHHRLDERLALGGPHDEVKDLADSFDDMLDRLSTAFDAQQRFVANASHELRTPLATARTALDVPLSQGRVPPGLEPAVRRALAAGERSARLLDALLVLAHARRAPREAQQEAVDLADLTARSLEEAAPVVARRALTVRTEVSAAALRGHATMLEQLCHNLVQNAVTHTLDGGLVEVACAADGDEVVLRVVNDGRPLDPATVDDLREPFHRGEHSRLAAAARAGTGPATTGSGLGLAIVDQIVLLHAGRMTLEAPEGGGLVVTVRLPARPRA